jgi:hypothetical protein
MTINCELVLCVYYENGKCILDSIEINSLGMCDACITVDIPEEYISEKRQALLKQFEEQYKEWETVKA